MASKIDRIATMLVSGIQASSICQIVGVAPSYISNLKADPDFNLHLSALREELASSDSGPTEEEIYSDKLLGAEHKIVTHLMDRLNYMADNHAVAALQAVGARRDAITKQNALASFQASAANGNTTIRMVEISIPSISAPDLVIGKNNEVVSIGSRAITPMPAATLQAMLNNTNEVIDHETLDSL